jgi:23S rRNA (adenine2503-C2)-methyltransferase
MVARYPLRDIVFAAREYALASKLPVALNYLLLAGENDSDADAARLTALLHSSPPAKQGGSKGGASWCKINLMEYNEVGSPFTRASGDRTGAFLNLLRNAGLTVTLRTSRGGDIAGACGQLAGEYAPGSGRVPEALP